MARSDVDTFGLLNRWPLVVREDVWTFNQVTGSGALVVPNRQNLPYIQTERDMIATALHDAARHVSEHLGFFPRPTWVEETVTVNRDNGWNRQTLETRWAHLRAIGRRAASLIVADAAVTYSDSDADGVDDTATITVTTDVEAAEVEVFVRTADGAPSAAHPRWQIDGLRAAASGGSVTLTGHRALLVQPAVWAQDYDGHQLQTKHAADTGTPGDFLTAVDVYRVYADPTQAVELVLNPDLVGEGNDRLYVTADITNSEAGYFTLRAASGQTLPLVQPAVVRLWYQAGLPLVDGGMNRQLETAIIRYANTLLPQEPAMLPRSLAMYPDDRKPFEQPLPYVPTFGLTQAGVYLARIVDGWQHKLKGKPVYVR